MNNFWDNFYSKHFFEKNFKDAIFNKLHFYQIGCSCYLSDLAEIEDVLEDFRGSMKSHPAYEGILDYYSGISDDVPDEDIECFFSNYFAQALYNGLLYGFLSETISEENDRKTKLKEKAYDFSEKYYEDMVPEIKEEPWYSNACIPHHVDFLVTDAYKYYGELADEPISDEYLQIAFDFIFGLGVALYDFFASQKKQG